MVVSRDFYIGFRSVDEAMYLKNSEMLNMFTDIAGIHSKEINRGFHDVDFRWLVVGYKVEVLKRPKFEDEVQVVTWSRGIRSAIAAREFEIRDMEGNLMVKVLSNFVKVNPKTQRIERISEEDLSVYQSEPERTNFGDMRLPRMKMTDTYDKQENLFIDWRWMDVNRHMNNSYYVELAEHILPKEARKNCNLNGFDIMYKQQILENTNVKCGYTETENSYVVAFVSEDESIVHSVVEYHKEK